jgi:hypothetical protein
VGEVIGDLEIDWRELDPAYLVDEFGEAGGPTPCLSANDCLERLALAFIGALVDEEAHGRIGCLAGPEVPFKATDSDDVQPVERHIAVVPLADVPGEDALAPPLVRCLGERATAGNPVTGKRQTSRRRVASAEHRASLPPRYRFQWTRSFHHAWRGIRQAEPPRASSAIFAAVVWTSPVGRSQLRLVAGRGLGAGD